MGSMEGHFIAFRTLCKSQNTFQDADHRASDRSVHGQRWQISAFRNVSLSASLHRSQAPQPLRLQDFDCAKEAKCTCGKTKRPPTCDGSHAKRSKAGFVQKLNPIEQHQLTADSMLIAQEQ